MPADAPIRIFLSYGHDGNEELVVQIAIDLKARGHDVWIDRHEIKAGDDWRREITDGIVNSHRVFSFLSKHSTRDPGVCLDEIAIALGVKGGNIQTILVESEAEVNPPASISHIQWLDMHDWKERRAAGEAAWSDWYGRRLAEIVSVVESDEGRRFAGEIEALARHLKPISSDARIASLLRRRFVGRTWLMDAVERWRMSSDDASRVFLIVGEPGVGKSALAAHLSHFGRDKVVAAQFVEWDKLDHRDPRRVIRSIAFQLATRLPDYRKLLLTLPEIDRLDSKDAAELFDYLLVNPAQIAIGGRRQRHLIVIDALDEAGDAQRNTLAEMLARHAPRLSDWLRLVVTARAESAVLAALQSLNPLVLDTRSEANRADIAQYVRQELAAQLETPARQGLRDAIVQRIVNNSEGVFLYAERFCEEVRSERLSLDHPDQFPQGLGEILLQWFARQFPDLQRFRETIRPMLSAVLAAREPLAVQMLGKLFGWHEDELRDAARELGSLFPVAKEHGVEVVKPYHKSLADVLTDARRAGAFFVSAARGHELLACYGLRLYRADPGAFSGYICRHLPYHVAQTGDSAALVSLLADPRLGYFEQWAERGMAWEGIACLEFACQRLEPAGMAPLLVAILATQLGRLFNRVGEPVSAERWLESALHAQSGGSAPPPAVQAVAWHELGSSAMARGDYPAARRAYRRALRCARRAVPPIDHEIAANLIGLAVIGYLMTLNTRRTVRLGRLALKHAEAAGDAPHIAESCRILADALKDDMQYAAAEAYVDRGLHLAHENALTHATLSLLTSKAWTTYQHAALDEPTQSDAHAVFAELRRLAEAAGDWRFQADAWSGIGQMAVLKRDARLLDEAISRLETLDRQPARPHVTARRMLLEAARLHWARHYEQAANLYARTAEYAVEKGLWSRHADALIGQGAALLHGGDRESAEQVWQMMQQTVLPRCPRVRGAIASRAIEACRRDPAACPL